MAEINTYLAAAIGWETVQMPTRSDRWPRKSRAVNIGLEGQYKCREVAMIAACRNKGSPCAPESGCLIVNQVVSVGVMPAPSVNLASKYNIPPHSAKMGLPSAAWARIEAAQWVCCASGAACNSG